MFAVYHPLLGESCGDSLISTISALKDLIAFERVIVSKVDDVVLPKSGDCNSDAF